MNYQVFKNNQNLLIHTFLYLLILNPSFFLLFLPHFTLTSIMFVTALCAVLHKSSRRLWRRHRLLAERLITPLKPPYISKNQELAGKRLTNRLLAERPLLNFFFSDIFFFFPKTHLIFYTLIYSFLYTLFSKTILFPLYALFTL